LPNHKSYTIVEVAKMFGSKIKFLNQRPGERYASALTNLNLKNKVFKHFGKIKLKDYIRNITK
jgi:UDP-glucose 4-epimerase